MHDSGPKLYLGTFEVNRKNKQSEKFSFQTHRYFSMLGVSFKRYNFGLEH